MRRKKYQRGKTAEQMADDLEEDISAIQPIYDLIKKYPDKDDKYILEQIQTK